MGTLVFVCPTTGLEVFTGLEMDIDTFADLPGVLPQSRCPHLPNPINSVTSLPAWLKACAGRTRRL